MGRSFGGLGIEAGALRIGPRRQFLCSQSGGLNPGGVLSRRHFAGGENINGAGKASSIFIPEMIDIPGGTFKMGGTRNSDEQPIRQIKLSAFRLGKYEVTNEEWKKYLEATGQEVPELAADPSKARHPVVKVSWHDAVKYCEWAGKRLPTEAEWEYAARGTDGREYPWGNKFDPSKATFNTTGTRPVDAHPEGVSPFGIMDMAGNVWEWVSDWYAHSYDSYWYAHNYDSADLVDPKGPKNGRYKVLRGGSWNGMGSVYLRGALRGNLLPWDWFDFVGFRVAEDI